MTHMHIPDGILPVWLWLGGYAAVAAVLAVCLFRLRGMDRRREIPLLGALAAVMLVAMNLEVFPIAYHLNLSVVAGILLGPSLGFIAAFIVNIMLALIGHGGITVMGLNTLLLGAEAFFGHSLFYLLPGSLPVFWRGAIATVAALLLASLLLIAIVGASHAEVQAFLHDPAEHGEGGPGPAGASGASLSTFAVMVLSFGAVGWIIEGAITGAVIRFISRVKPDLLAHVLHAGKAGGAS
jgi:cobalt/nickel transport system permease protein